MGESQQQKRESIERITAGYEPSFRKLFRLAHLSNPDESFRNIVRA